MANETTVEKSAIKEFATKVSRYFLDFLETDFKRQQAPRRRIVIKNDAGFRTAVPLRKYRTLYTDIWKLLATPVGENKSLQIIRGHYRAPIGPALQNLIRQHVDHLESRSFEAVRAGTAEAAVKHRAKSVENPEQYVNEITTRFAELVGQHVVAPILALLDGPFREQAYAVIESVFEVETDLTDALCGAVVEQLPTALNTFLVKGDLTSTKNVLSEFFSESAAKDRLKDFFEGFATADAYQEIRDVHRYAELGGEALQIYLYVGELRFGSGLFPLFYIPIACEISAETGAILVKPGLPLYAHKRAIEYLIQELRTGGTTARRLELSPIENRIVYLKPEETYLDVMGSMLGTLLTVLDLRGEMNWKEPKIEVVQSANLRLSKAAYIAAFEKSDESLLNDYEALLAGINQDQVAVIDLFQRIIEGFLLEDPRSLREAVATQWDGVPIAQRLVAASPIPLNEEQRKILVAVRDDHCRFLAIQGPPGTGKSHTITAIAFDCILAGRNVLILSDKTEALDVVEDKLSSTLHEVRQNSDFPNPILRLGRTGGSYRRLISQAAQEQIRTHYRAARANEQRVNENIQRTEETLKDSINQTLDTLGRVSLKEVEELIKTEEALEAAVPTLPALLQRSADGSTTDTVRAAIRALPPEAPALRQMAHSFPKGTFVDLVRHVQAHAVAQSILVSEAERRALSLFRPLTAQHIGLLSQFVFEYRSLRWPILGYRFRGTALIRLATKINSALPCNNASELRERLAELETVLAVVIRIHTTLSQASLGADLIPWVYLRIVSNTPRCPDIEALRVVLESFHQIIAPLPEIIGAFYSDGVKRHTAGTLGIVGAAMRYQSLWNRVAKPIGKLVPPDYVGLKSHLEQLYTTRMAAEIDRRFVQFVDDNRTTAKILGGVIKDRQQFPQDSFAKLKEAFPVIIAGIREFAEYVPLRADLFDIVIIDEASQVSVAQAFPAILRAKKLIVLGDARQFANIKSSYASIEMNSKYLGDLDSFFRSRISNNAGRLQRLKQFDVKKSVLEFVDLISNYSDMLRKHFRGYAELISFSSKYFYGSQLQAIKVRAKPVEEVIRFTEVEPEPRPEKYRNVNTAEATFILDHLKEILKSGELMTVGIITPFREQQEYLSRVILNDVDANRFENDLRLKIMTFDTCQGEERDLVLYSMVATQTHDLLNYIFPVSIENAEDRIEDALKMQRLNVGLSRAKECIHFVISKPVDEFHGSIGRALAHYRWVLQERSVPEAEDTDPASPMEAQVLEWITNTPFFQKNEEVMELTAQFPMGDYLKQLDPTYQHPAYRVDFLLQYRGQQDVNIVIEYDGLKEHFQQDRGVHAGNYEFLYKPEDLERQFVIESYGYKVLRINRFNIGHDPVATLSTRLEELVDHATREGDDGVVGQIRNDVESINNGEGKFCKQCGKVRTLDMFFDQTLAGGKGGYGRVCMLCKGSKQTAVKSPRHFRRYRR